jgi:hypothetical protein
MPELTISVRHCVLCDDVREEVGGKETIVGVYTAGMSVPIIPWLGLVCVWMAVIWSGDGQLELEIRVSDPTNAVVGKVGGVGTAVWQGIESTLTFRGLSLNLEREGILNIEWRAGGAGWERIRQFPVFLIRPSTTGA